MDKSKNDVSINGQSYRARSYVKSEFAPFVPRLGAGDPTESHFDLLKSRTSESFEGGELQFDFIDNNEIFASQGLEPWWRDGSISSSSQPTRQTNFTNKHLVTAKAESPQNGYQYVATADYTASTTSNKIYRITTGLSLTALTLPANLQDQTIGRILSMVVWQGYLIISQAGNHMYQCVLTGTTVTEITAGTAMCFGRMAVWKGDLYGTSVGADQLYKYTGTTATRAQSLIGDTFSYITYSGDGFNNTVRLQVFAGRLVLTRPDGLWAYDGMNFLQIEVADFSFAAVYRGYLYFFRPDGLYRYNFSLVEKVYDYLQLGSLCDISTTWDGRRMFILTINANSSASPRLQTRHDLALGLAWSDNNHGDGVVWEFDGKGIWATHRTTTFDRTTQDFADQCDPHTLILLGTKYVSIWRRFDYNGYWDIVEQDATHGFSPPAKLVTSVFDGDFPSVRKSFQNFNLYCDYPSGVTINFTLYYRTSGFDLTGNWTSLGNFQLDDTHFGFSTVAAALSGINFNRIQFMLVGNTSINDKIRIRKWGIQYLLMPAYKWQWTLNLALYGDNELEPLRLKDGSVSSDSITTLRGTLYKARDAGTPVSFIDVDTTDLNGTINASATTITLTSTLLLKSFGYVVIDNEIIGYTSKNDTQLLGCVRGMFGTTAASHTSAALVHPFYLVIVRQIQSEKIILDDRDVDRQSGKAYASEMNLVLTEI